MLLEDNGLLPFLEDWRFFAEPKSNQILFLYFSPILFSTFTIYTLISETHKGLKRVTLICLLCPMLVIIHFRKYHIWNEKKR